MDYIWIILEDELYLNSFSDFFELVLSYLTFYFILQEVSNFENVKPKKK